MELELECGFSCRDGERNAEERSRERNKTSVAFTSFYARGGGSTDLKDYSGPMRGPESKTMASPLVHGPTNMGLTLPLTLLNRVVPL